MQDRVWRLVESDVEVLSLLAGAGDFSVGHMVLEGFGAAADFAVDDVVFVAGAGGDGAREGVLADVVHYAGDFADLVALLAIRHSRKR